MPYLGAGPPGLYGPIWGHFQGVAPRIFVAYWGPIYGGPAVVVWVWDGGGLGLCGWVGGVFFVDECYGGVDGCAEDLADGPGACDEEDG